MRQFFKDLWHRMWGLHAEPIEIQVNWRKYFKKGVRDYIRTMQAELNSPDALERMAGLQHELNTFGSATITDDYGA